MRAPLSSLDGRAFDALVIGAGANGASAAQHMAAQGNDVLLVDKDDFASGSSSRSSRLLHCGLRYLAPGRSLWEFARHPGRFVTACRMARQAMEARAQFVRATPERVRPLTFGFPVYAESAYRPWQIDMALRLLGRLGGREVPLDRTRLPPGRVQEMPLFEHLRDPDRLEGVLTFREYQFDWPERIVIDTVLDAERLGATVRNYTSVRRLARKGEGWRATLADAGGETAEIEVRTAAVFNMAGIWIDEVGGRIDDARPDRRITGTKGAHIVVRLPPDCADRGIVTLNRMNQPFYCVPWRGLHYFGPTETLYEGDREEIAPTEEEFAFLLDEANHLLPGLGLERKDVLFGWAGVRPLTYDPSQPMGARARELRAHGPGTLRGLFDMTAGPVMTHRSAGAEAARSLASRVPPRRAAQAPCYSARPPADDTASPALVNRETGVTVADIRRAAREEQALTLEDALFRRTGIGWSDGMGRDAVRVAADAMAQELGWSAERREREVERYLDLIARRYHLADAG